MSICRVRPHIVILYIRYFKEKFVPLHPENGLLIST